MLRSLIVYSVLASLFVERSVGEIICAKDTLSEMDQSMATILMNGVGSKYPENRSQVPAFCSNVSQALKEIEDYRGKCMRDLAKQVTGVTLYTVRKLHSDLCRKSSKRMATLLSAAKCANALNGRKDSCHNKFIDALLGIYHAEDKYKIPLVCCSYFKVEDCDRAAARRLSACTEDSLEDTIRFTNELTQSTVNSLCGDYSPDSDKCQRLPARPNKKKGQLRTRSFFLPLINILESLPDNA